MLIIGCNFLFFDANFWFWIQIWILDANFSFWLQIPINGRNAQFFDAEFMIQLLDANFNFQVRVLIFGCNFRFFYANFSFLDMRSNFGCKFQFFDTNLCLKSTNERTVYHRRTPLLWECKYLSVRFRRKTSPNLLQ